jgi:hypothetical protein
MFRSFAFTLVCILSASPAAADFARYQCRAQGPVKVITHGSTCRGFHADKKEVMFPRIASGTLVSSKDGRTVVMIEDYLSGTITKAGIEADYDLEVIVNPRVLHVYRDGVRVAAHDIARLVKDVDKVGQSISHIRWVETMPSEIGEKSFEITTTTKRRITFDSKTGAILAEVDAPRAK